MRRQRASSHGTTRADYTLTIATKPIELAPKRIVSITKYNGQFPGPLLRFKEGERVTVDVHNNTDTPEQHHWHGRGFAQMSMEPPKKEGDVQPALSSDEKTVAFLKMPNADMMELYTVPLSGGPVRQMTADGHYIGPLMWSADGRRIVFNSDRNGSNGVWQVPATGGSIQPEFEFPAVGSLSRDGRRLAYEGSQGLSGRSSTIWRAELPRPASHSFPKRGLSPPQV